MVLSCIISGSGNWDNCSGEISAGNCKLKIHKAQPCNPRLDYIS